MISLPKEIEEGCIEYKRDLLNIDDERKNHLASQMKWRIKEGNGKAIYYIGINDDGSFYGLEKKDLNICIKTIKEIAKIINAKIIKLERENINNKFYCKIEIEHNIEKTIQNYRVLFIGNSQSGKSTTINVLLNNMKDDGKGSARISLFNHKHEIYSGRTSSISIRYFGFKNNKCINNDCISTDNILQKSDKLIHLIDFPGNLKYYKTIFTKLNIFNPNLIFITINPFNINYKIIKLYLYYCKINNLYFNVLFTHFDKKNFNKKIINIINFFKNNKVYLEEFNNTFIKNTNYYICISNTTLYNLDKLKNIINNLSNKIENNNYDNEIQIINKYNNNELGIVLSGLCLNGRIKKNDKLYLEADGIWHDIIITNLHISQNEYTKIKKDNLVGIYFKLLKNKIINKPSLIVSNKDKYNFIDKITFKIFFISKKFILKNNMNILLFIRNNIYTSKIININNKNITIILKNKIIDKSNNLIFKINNIYGIASIINKYI